MCIATILMAEAAYHGLRHPRAKPGHSYLGRMVGTLLCMGYALYYYWLYITL
jgi:cation:H+ antiporter